MVTEGPIDTTINEVGMALIGRCVTRTRAVSFVTPAVFADRLARKRWIVVDIRALWRRRVSSIPGSISRETFDSCRGMYLKRQILVVDTAGCESPGYVRALRREGLSAHALYGGVVAWATTGRLLVDADGEPTRCLAIPCGIATEGARACG